MAKKKCPECKPCAAADWMLTFSDLMTLLLTFFVLLLSFSSISEDKFTQAMGSLKGALSVLKSNNTMFIRTKFAPVYTKRYDSEGEMKEKLQQILEQVDEEAKKAGLKDKVQTSRYKDRIHFRLSDDLLFSSGSATLNTKSDSLFAKISKVLNLVPYNIRVEGHTDNVPIATARYRNNWELSSSRALSVVQKLISFNLAPERFEVIGYGEFHPIASNATTQGKSLNRRVEIFVNLKKDVKKNKNLLPN